MYVAMKKQKITQRKLAEVLKLNRSSLCNILHGRRRPSLAKAVALEKISGIPRLLWLFGDKVQLRREIKTLYGEINFHPPKKASQP